MRARYGGLSLTEARESLREIAIPYERLLYEQLQWLYRQLPADVLANLLLVAIVLGVYWTSVSHWVLIPWVLWMLLVSMLRYGLARWYQSGDKLKRQALWKRLMYVSAGLNGASWGSAGALLFVPDAFGHQVFLVFVLGSICAAAVSTLAVYLRIFLVFFVPALLPVTFLLAMAGDRYHRYASLVVVLFAVMQVISASRFHRSFAESLRVRYENTELIKDLATAKTAAEAASRLKSTFISTMSHELRTPLNSVLGFSNLLLKNRKGHLDEKELTLVRRIEANGRYLLEVINGILELSRAESGRMTLNKGLVRLPQLIREVVEHMQGQVVDKDVALCMQVPDDCEGIISDGGKIRQILINLIGNAIKFTEHGHVTVRLVVDAKSRQPQRIEVQDTGIGIARDKLERIFEAFTQADSTIGQRFGGTGLGLTISKTMADLMGCTLEVDSVPGQGSTFALVFHRPVLADQDHTLVRDHLYGSIDEEEVRDQLRGKKVLVIEHQPDTQETIRQYLDNMPCELLVADDGAQGIALALAEQPDVIVLDLELPHVNGWEVLLRFRHSPNLGRTPILVISSSEAVEGMAMGGMLALVLPITRDALLKSLCQCLQMTRRNYVPRILLAIERQKVLTEIANVLEVDRADLKVCSDVAHLAALLEDFAADLVLLDEAFVQRRTEEERDRLIRLLQASGRMFAMIVSGEAPTVALGSAPVPTVRCGKGFARELKALVRKACRGA